MSRRHAPLRWLAVTICLGALSGCYQGEWRLGPEIPLSSTTRLMPTRDIERWELSQSMTPNVVQVKGSVTQRCRFVQYGTSRRNDTGQFRRVGSTYWTAASIVLGSAGGALAGIGAAGWLSQLYGFRANPAKFDPTTQYALYGAGGAVAAGGLVSCISSITSPTKIRLALCGIMVGFGGSVLIGSVLSDYPVGSVPGTANAPLLDQTTFRSLALAGASLVGMALFTGIISASWRGMIDRERIVETENAQIWDPQSGEQNCGGQRSISGRAANLEISAQNLTEGLGSDSSPLRVRVAMSGQAVQAIDLRGLRSALPSCGSLTVRLAPDILYEDSPGDDYTPSLLPSEMNAINRVVHGSISPREGISLPASQASASPSPKAGGPRQPLPGISSEVLATLEKRCRAEAGDSSAATERPPSSRRPPAVAAPSAPAGDPADAPVRTLPEARPTTAPSVSLTPSRPAAPLEVNECSAEAQQARFADCEHQCGRALELSTCLFDFRKCHIAARSAPLPQKERDTCDLAWEQCLFKTNVGPGSWRRCVEGCTQANEPQACHSPR